MGRRDRLGLSTAAALVAVAFQGSQAQAAPQYDLWQIGLTNGPYTYTTGSGLAQTTTIEDLNEAGQALVYTRRYDATGTSLGQDAWLSNGNTNEQLGYLGAGYSYNTGTGIYQFTEPVGLNSTGQVTGYSRGYAADGTSMGAYAWLYNGATTEQIGLTGGPYSYSNGYGTYQLCFPQQLNDAGQVEGYSERLSSTGTIIGEDCWFFNGTSTQQIGLTGGVYTYNNGSEILESSEPTVMNQAGQVAGETARTASDGTPLGNDSWFFNGTSTQVIGLTGPGDSYSIDGGTYEVNIPQMMNNAGEVVGTASRSNAGGTDLGGDCWLFNGTTTLQVGLTGGIYSYDTGNGISQLTKTQQLNNAGQVIGYSLPL